MLCGRLGPLPAALDGSKRPAVAWEQYQHRLPTDAELVEWFGDGTRTGLGIVAGGISGNLEMTEFLIANGADPAATDADGKTARQSAQATVKGILKMTDDKDGQHTGPIKKVIKYLEQPDMLFLAMA